MSVPPTRTMYFSKDHAFITERTRGGVRFLHIRGAKKPHVPYYFSRKPKLVGGELGVEGWTSAGSKERAESLWKMDGQQAPPPEFPFEDFARSKEERRALGPLSPQPRESLVRHATQEPDMVIEGLLSGDIGIDGTSEGEPASPEDVEKAVRAANLPKRTAEMLISSLRSLDSLHKKIAQSDEAAERRAAAQSDEAKDLAAGMLARLDEECKKTLARLDEEGKKTRTQSAADKNEIKSHAAQIGDRITKNVNEFTATSHAQTQQTIAIEAAKTRRAVGAAEDRVKKAVMAFEDSQQRLADVQEEINGLREQQVSESNRLLKDLILEQKKAEENALLKGAEHAVALAHLEALGKESLAAIELGNQVANETLAATELGNEMLGQLLTQGTHLVDKAKKMVKDRSEGMAPTMADVSATSMLTALVNSKEAKKLKKTVEAAGKGEKVDLAKLAAAIIQMLEGSDEEIEAALMTTYALTRRLGAWFNQELRQILPYVIKHAFAKSDKPVKLRIFTAEVLYSIWLRNPLGVSYLSAVDPKSLVDSSPALLVNLAKAVATVTEGADKATPDDVFKPIVRIITALLKATDLTVIGAATDAFVALTNANMQSAHHVLEAIVGKRVLHKELTDLATKLDLKHVTVDEAADAMKLGMVAKAAAPKDTLDLDGLCSTVHQMAGDLAEIKLKFGTLHTTVTLKPPVVHASPPPPPPPVFGAPPPTPVVKVPPSSGACSSKDGVTATQGSNTAAASIIAELKAGNYRLRSTGRALWTAESDARIQARRSASLMDDDEE